MDVLIIVGIIGLALLGAPLFAIFAAAAMLLFANLEDTSLTGAAADIFSEKFAESPLLVTIPLFTFAGYVMAESGTPKRLVRVSRAVLGWMPGGLAIVAVAASAFFTAFTGGSGITIVAVGGLLFPALVSQQYSERFSLGLVTTGGSLGLLFPPSVPIVLFAVVAGIEVQQLFVAGILPGLLTLFLLAGYSVVVGGKREKRQPFDLQEASAAFVHALPEILLPIVLVGSLATGIFRIHEAAAFAALYVLIVEVFVYKDVDLRTDLPRITRDSMTLVGAILAILATAIGFTAYLIQDQLPMQILEAMSSTITSKVMFLLVLNVFLLLVGMLMDIFSAIVVVVPLILPIARSFGVDPYHLGIVFLLNLEIGYMTPPVGLNLFISSYRFKRPVTELYRAVLPFIGLLIVALLVTTYVEDLSLAFVERSDDLVEEPVPLPDDVERTEPVAEEPPPGGGGGLDALEDLLDDDADLGGSGGGLDALEDELDEDEDGPGGLDALEAELDEGDEEREEGLSGLDALEAELGGDGDDGDEEPAEGLSGLDALEAELADDGE